MLQAVMNLFTSLGQRGRELMNNPQAQQLFSAASKAVSDMRATRNENDEKIEKIGDTRLKKMLKLDNNAQFSCHSESSSSGAVFYAVFLPEAKSIWKSPDEKSVRLLCSKLNPLTDVSLDKTQMAQRLSALMEIHWKEPDWAAIHYAVACGFTSYLTTMIKKDPEIVLNYATADGRFPLNIAAQTEQLDSLRLLLNAGAPLNQSDASGRTVVHWAAASSATILKELSSSPSFQPCLLMLDGDGMSPLAVAIRAGNLETVKLLMGVSAPLGALSSGPLLNAVVGLKYNDNIGKILELITTVSPKVVEQTDGNGRTVLHKALDKMILMCILRSSHQHIDVNRGDKSGNSALHLAVERDELATTVGLLTYGADVNTTNANGETPLMKAAKNCSIMLVKCLLLFDARLDVKNTSGQDVFKYSESNRQRAEVDSLLNFAKTGAGVGPAELDAMEQFSQKLAMEYHASQKPADGKPKTINVLSLDGGGIRGLSLFRLKDDVFTGKRPFNEASLESLLKAEYGAQTTMATIAQENKRVMVTTCKANVSPPELKLIRSYRLPLGEEENKRMGYNDPKSIPAWYAARCSSAAPTYFKAVENTWMDGGLVANNPCSELLTDIHNHNTACRMMGDGSSVRVGCVVSLGTGRGPTVSVESVDLAPPTGFLDIIRKWDTVVHLKNLLIEQIACADGAAVSRSRAWSHSLPAPYFRFSPRLAKAVELDETDDAVLVDMMWQTKVYMASESHSSKQLIDFLKI